MLCIFLMRKCALERFSKSFYVTHLLIRARTKQAGKKAWVLPK